MLQLIEYQQVKKLRRQTHLRYIIAQTKTKLAFCMEFGRIWAAQIIV